MESNEVTLVESWFAGKTYFEVLDNILEELDCTKISPIGRIMQTINSRYKFLMEAYNYVLNCAMDANRINIEQFNFYKGKLDERHIANLEFEKDNPPVVYTNKKKAKATPSTGGKKIATSIKSRDLITGAEVIEAIKDIRPTPKKKKEAKPKAVKVITKDNIILDFNKK